MSGVQTRQIGPDDGDQRLDRYMRRLFPHVTQGRVEKMCRKGDILTDHTEEVEYATGSRADNPHSTAAHRRAGRTSSVAGKARRDQGGRQADPILRHLQRRPHHRDQQTCWLGDTRWVQDNPSRRWDG